MQIRRRAQPPSFSLRVPRVMTSSVEAGPERDRPILDGQPFIAENRWHVARCSVAMVGRPAVWIALDLTTPQIKIGPFSIPARRVRWEQDFGGHLFLAVANDDGSRVAIVEAGPTHPNGTGGLVPFRYPEDHFAERGFLDFEPVIIEPPHGLDAGFFDALVNRTHREYDGNQRYLVVELPFLRVGRDSNSYTVGVLLACGVDPRAIPRMHDTIRFEITGYPGVADPVHLANFGVYPGAPHDLGDGALAVAYHDADGSVRFVVIGGAPHERVRTPHGEVTLDERGRCVLPPDDASRHGLPARHTAPPEQISTRRRFPNDPAAAGALITLIVEGAAVPLRPGDSYRGSVVARNDALGLAIMRGDAGEIVLPLTALGVELRDPKRLERLVQIGSEVTVGLHRDRHPRLIAHGRAAREDAFHPRRAHAPRPVTVAATAAVLGAVGLGVYALARRA